MAQKSWTSFGFLFIFIIGRLSLSSGQVFILDETTSGIYYAPLPDGNDDNVMNGRFTLIPTNGMGENEIPSLVDFDPVGKFVYYAKDFIARVRLNGSEDETILTAKEMALSSISSISVDPINKFIYWTGLDTSFSLMSLANLDGSEINDLLSSQIAKPTVVATDPENELLYWTTGSAQMRRGDKFTFDVVTLLENQNVSAFHVQNCPGVPASNVYYVANGTVNMMNYNGSDRAVITDLPFNNLYNSTSLAKYGDYVFWIGLMPGESDWLPVVYADNIRDSEPPQGVNSITLTDGSTVEIVPSFIRIVLGPDGDNVPPVITNCPEDASMDINDVDGDPAATTYSWTEPTADDHLSCAAIEFMGGDGDVTITNGGNFPVGATTVSYQAVDAAGNVAVCSFTVTVRDPNSSEGNDDDWNGCGNAHTHTISALLLIASVILGLRS